MSRGLFDLSLYELFQRGLFICQNWAARLHPRYVNPKEYTRGRYFFSRNLWKRVFHCQCDRPGHGPAGQSPVQTFVKHPKKRPTAGSLNSKELSYVIKNVLRKRECYKGFKNRAFQTTWIERFEAFLATCSLDPDLDLCFVQTWIEYV